MTTATISKGRKMVARYPGKCQECGSRVSAGATIFWAKGAGVTCQPCGEPVGNDPEAQGAAFSNHGKPGGCEGCDGECSPTEFNYRPCWAGGRCIDAPCCGCGI